MHIHRRTPYVVVRPSDKPFSSNSHRLFRYRCDGTQGLECGVEGSRRAGETLPARLPLPNPNQGPTETAARARWHTDPELPGPHATAIATRGVAICRDAMTPRSNPVLHSRIAILLRSYTRPAQPYIANS